ncbi:phage tail tape measure protein [Helcococcus bovis]|uniref:Phage tail tape measure protein n=1 Tax=Helcococcus bovis TaxID=3153252 RepID=A0ABW9F803_9FIRM
MANSRKIRGITIEFGANATKLLKVFSEIKNKTNDLQRSYKDINKLLKFNPSNVELLRQKQDNLNATITETRKKLEQLQKMQTSLSNRGIEENSEQFKTLRREIIDTESALRNYESQLKNTDSALSYQTNSLKNVSEKFKNFGDKLKSVGNTTINAGKKIAKFGGFMTLGVTAPLAKLGKDGVSSLTDFDTALIGVSKTTNLEGKALKKYGDDVLEISKKLPYAAEEFLKVSENAGQLGIAEKDLKSFTEVMLRMGQSTNLSAEEASVAIAKIFNVMGLSSDKYSNFGSAVVDLGNNFATTEADIVNMASKLSGTAKIVDLTADEMLGLSTALSSVGVEAELGGTNMGKVLKKIQTGVLAGGKALDAFARASNVSSKTFSNAWKKSPVEALKLLLGGLEKTRTEGGNVFGVMEDLGIKSQREQEVVAKLAGARGKLNEALILSKKAYKENTALTIESEKRNKSLASRMQVLKNQFHEISIKIGEVLVPILEQLVPLIEKGVKWFSNLSTESKSNIAKMALLAAAIGPVATAIGGLVSAVGLGTKGLGLLSKGISVVLPLFGKATASTVAMSGASRSAVRGFTALGTKLVALAGGAGPLALWVAGIAGVVIAGKKLYDYMSESAIPQTDLFGEKVSEATKKAVGGFLKLEEEGSKSLKNLMWSGDTITKKGISPIIQNFSEMKKQIIEGLTTQEKEATDSITKLFQNARTITETEKNGLLEDITASYESRKANVIAGEARIKEILMTASSEKRALTKEEGAEITGIRQKMKEEGISALSATEAEFMVIMQRMKDNGSNISAEQSAQIVANSIKTRDKTIKNAEEEYNERIRVAEQLRAEGGAKAEENANKIIEEARRQRDEAIEHAKDMHNGVVKHAKQQASEHVNHIDWEKGEVKSRFQTMIADFNDWDDRTTEAFENWVSKSVASVGTWASETGTAIGNWVSSTAKSISTWASDTLSSVGTWASDFIGKTKEAMNGAKKWIRDKISDIKGLFNFKWKWPHIPLPHFSFSGSANPFSGNFPPRISVDWYAKGGIFTQPTIFPTMNGMVGVGEPSTGGEAVLPLIKLPDLMAEALEKSRYNSKQTIVNYFSIDGKVVAHEITDVVDENLGKKSMRQRYAGGLL